MRIIALIDDARFVLDFLYPTNVRKWPFAALEIMLFHQKRTTANGKSRRSDFDF